MPSPSGAVPAPAPVRVVRLLAGAPAPPELVERSLELRFAAQLSVPALATRWLLGLLMVVHVLVDLVTVPRLVPNSVDGTAGFLALVVVGAKVNGLVSAGEWWRLATMTVLHAGLLHLLLNGLSLLVLGRIAENLLGRTAFLLVYLGSALASSLASWAFSAAPSVGASGAIYGLLGAIIAYGWVHRRRIPRRLRRLLVISPALCLALQLPFFLLLPQLDNAAHAGGLVVGLVCGPALGDQVLRRRPLVPAWVQRAVVAALAVFVGTSLLIMAPRVFADGVEIPTALARGGGLLRGLPVPAGWEVGVLRRRHCEVAPPAAGPPRRGIPCLTDAYGSILVFPPLDILDEEEARMLRGLPSRSPTDPYLVRLSAADAPGVYRRRQWGPTSHQSLLAQGPPGRATQLWTLTGLAPDYVPLMQALSAAASDPAFSPPETIR